MAPIARILLLDEDTSGRNALVEVLRANGYTLDVHDRPVRALRGLADYHPDVVLVSADLPDLTLRAFVIEVLARIPDCVVILAARDAESDVVVQAMQEGAADCVAAPACVRRLSIVLRRELERQRLRRELHALRARVETGSIYATLAPAAPAVPGTSLEALERFVILRTLEHTQGSTTRAATILGISARKIQYKLHEYKTH